MLDFCDYLKDNQMITFHRLRMLFFIINQSVSQGEGGGFHAVYWDERINVKLLFLFQKSNMLNKVHSFPTPLFLLSIFFSGATPLEIRIRQVKYYISFSAHTFNTEDIC